MKRLKWRTKALLKFLQFHSGIFFAACNARRGSPRKSLPVCFIAGCGRSGTTMLGQLLSLHSGISYLNEPRTFWFAVSTRSDIWGYTDAEAKSRSLLISDAAPGEASRLNALFHLKMSEPRQTLVLEKTPENVFRLPWLHELAPQAKLIHIVRNGADVVRSILVEASFDIPYGLNDMNNWYGSKGRKRFLLAETARQLAIPSAVLSSCVTAEDWAALEWLCSLAAYEAGKKYFSYSGCYHLRYEDLLIEPWQYFSSLINFLELPSAPALEKSVHQFVRPSQPPAVIRLSLPLREIFVAKQKQYGYETGFLQ